MRRKHSSELTDAILACRQELGLLESLCFFKICSTRTSFGPVGAVEDFLRFEALSSSSSGSCPGVVSPSSDSRVWSPPSMLVTILDFVTMPGVSIPVTGAVSGTINSSFGSSGGLAIVDCCELSECTDAATGNGTSVLTVAAVAASVWFSSSGCTGGCHEASPVGMKKK